MSRRYEARGREVLNEGLAVAYCDYDFHAERVAAALDLTLGLSPERLAFLVSAGGQSALIWLVEALERAVEERRHAAIAAAAEHLADALAAKEAA